MRRRLKFDMQTRDIYLRRLQKALIKMYQDAIGYCKCEQSYYDYQDDMFIIDECADKGGLPYLIDIRNISKLIDDDVGAHSIYGVDFNYNNLINNVRNQENWIIQQRKYDAQ